MRTRQIWLTTALLMAGCAAAQIQELAFMEAMPAPQPPAIDGLMSDPLWETAPANTAYYEYWKSNPKPSHVKTEIRALYDSKGIYLGIRNFDDNIAGLRMTVTDHGNPTLWRDDCAEIYFGGSGHGGSGFRCFKVNALGSTDEVNKLDSVVTVPEWRGTGWYVKTSVGEDAWIIEGFFPWDDIGVSARAGDIIRLCHVRYKFSSGKFEGSTSSPGGNYKTPENYGFVLLSAPGKQTDPAALAQILKSAATPPWGIVTGSDLISDTGAGPRIEPLADVIASTSKLFQKSREACDLAAGEGTLSKKLEKEYEEIKAELSELPDELENTFDTLQTLNQLTRKLNDFQIMVKLEKEFN